MPEEIANDNALAQLLFDHMSSIVEHTTGLGTYGIGNLATISNTGIARVVCCGMQQYRGVDARLTVGWETWEECRELLALAPHTQRKLASDAIVMMGELIVYTRLRQRDIEHAEHGMTQEDFEQGFVRHCETTFYDQAGRPRHYTDRCRENNSFPIMLNADRTVYAVEDCGVWLPIMFNLIKNSQLTIRIPVLHMVNYTHPPGPPYFPPA